MLKNFFISMLGAIAGFWISIMLLVVVGFIAMAGAIASSILSSNEASSTVEKGSIMRIVLDSSIEERPTSMGLQQILNNQQEPQTLDNLVRAISAAKSDKRISGIYLQIVNSTAGFATREALVEALRDFKSSGKWIYAYADGYSQGDYYIASCADHLYLNPSGSVDIRGLSSTIPFFKGLLEKIGVKMQVFKVGTFKSAVEPFILDSISEPNREMTSHLLNGLWSNISTSIAENRKVEVANVNQWADSLVAVIEPKEYVTLKIVDGLKYENEVEDHLKELTSTKKDKDLKIIDYYNYLASAEVPHEKKCDNKIAVYYAFGDITDRGSEGITAEKMVPEILELAEDDDITAMVLRVNSGGGSAFASEQIWHALEVFKSKGKKFYVSMGDYAASGGYYISCGANKIYAQPNTLTGSIGIFGMFPNVKGLMNDKLGINFSMVMTNPNATFPNVYSQPTPAQAAKMQGAINRGYELFTSRCAQGRNIPQDSIKVIGEGRVWDGRTALKLGLVDELGSLSTTIDALAQEMGYKKYQVVTYPAVEKSFWNMIAEMPTRVKANAIREELGPSYPIYKSLKEMEEMNPIQARMIPIVIE